MIKNELVFKSFENCMAVTKAILEERSYAVMLTREEEYFVLDYVYADGADRNEVAFMERAELDEKYCEKVEDDESDS